MLRLLMTVAAFAAITSGATESKAEASGFLLNNDDLQTTQLATVVLVRPMTLFNPRLTETTLRRFGCTFTTRDSSRIAMLIALLKSADLKVVQSADHSWEQEPREGIFLTLTKGSEVKFLFGRRFTGQDTVRGEFSHVPDTKRQLLTGKQSLPEDLNKWAADTGPPIAQAPNLQLACERYFGNSPAK